ncbi:MAG: type IV pilin protein [Planctomycetota bacterium]|jgi:prepilin-type N-terminal cleavage/methylation domain-containing protein
MKKAFTLVELLIVVSILGILAAIVMPTFQSHVQLAKESAAKDNLRILRNAIELYASQHNEVAPGYLNGDTDNAPSPIITGVQLLNLTNASGQFTEPANPDYRYGPYLPELPQNPFNGRWEMVIVMNDQPFPDVPAGTLGWVYKPATKEIRLDWPGTDYEGISYYDY